MLATSVFLGEYEQTNFAIYTRIYGLYDEPFSIFICSIGPPKIFWKTPGGNITTFYLVVNKLFGDEGSKPCPSLMIYTISGCELITALVFAMSVCRDSPSKLWPCVLNNVIVYLWLSEFDTPTFTAIFHCHTHVACCWWVSLPFDPIRIVVLKKLLDLCVLHLIKCIDQLLLYSNKVWFIVGTYLSHIYSSCNQSS